MLGPAPVPPAASCSVMNELLMAASLFHQKLPAVLLSQPSSTQANRPSAV